MSNWPLQLQQLWPLLLILPAILAVWLSLRWSSLFGSQRRIVGIVRILLVVAVAIAACLPLWIGRRAVVRCVVVTDVSASVGSVTQNLDAWTKTWLTGRPWAARARIRFINFADGALDANAGRLKPHRSELADGLRRAIECIDLDGPFLIICRTDGRHDGPSPLSEARAIAAAGGRLAVIPTFDPDMFDVRIKSFRLPTRIAARDGKAVVPITITLLATKDTDARLIVRRGGKIIHEQDVPLSANRPATTSLTDTPPTIGLAWYTAVVETVGDQLPANDRLVSGVQVLGKPRLTLVTDKPEGYFAAALAKFGAWEVKKTAPADLPAMPTGLLGAQVVILDDVSAKKLTDAQQSALAAYVRDLGGGVLVAGGPNSFGPGGYIRTPLGEMLPVDPDPRSREPIALAVVLDRSGSMAGRPGGGRSKLDHAKEAALTLRKGLSETDRIAVVVFHTAPETIHPLTINTDFAALRRTLANVRIRGGGTQILPAVIAARKLLAIKEKCIRRILLLTDGRPEGARGSGPSLDALYRREAARLKTAGIELSAVGTGDVDWQLLRILTDATGGKTYAVANASRLGRVFFEDLIQSTRTFFDQREQPVRLLTRSPFGVEIAAPPPPLGGLVLTAARPVGEVLIEIKNDRKIPVLARRQFGLGRVVAITTSMDLDWTDRWRQWNGWSRMLPAMLDWLRRERFDPRFTLSVRSGDGRVRIRCDVSGENSDMNLSARLIRLGGNADSEVIPLRQSAPGRYEAELSIAGALLVAVLHNERPVATAIAGGGYPAEYRHTGPDYPALRRLAAAGGGRIVQTPSQLPTPPNWQTTDRHALWMWLLLTAAALAAVEIILRICWRV